MHRRRSVILADQSVQPMLAPDFGLVWKPNRPRQLAHVAIAAADHQPWAEVNDAFAADAVTHRAPAGGPESGKEPERNKNAVPVDGEVTEMKRDFVHAAGKLGLAI